MTAQDLTRLWSASLCKTHKWVLVVQCPRSVIKWCGHNIQFGYGTQVPEEELPSLVEEATQDNHTWAIYALTEPELPEQEAPLALDFVFPIHAAMLGEKPTIKDNMQAILDYADLQFANIGRSIRYRGIPSMEPTQHPVPDPVVDAYVCGKLLCSHEVQLPPQYGRTIATKTPAMADVWYARGSQEMLPLFYMQKIYGTCDRYWTYAIGATDSLDDADAALHAELHALEACLSTRADAQHALTRYLGANSDEYDDILAEENPMIGEAFRSLNSLHRKLLVVVRRSDAATNYGCDLSTHAEPLKKRLMLAHRNDALASIVRHAWPEIDTWES